MAENRNKTHTDQWFQACPVGMLILDGAGRILEANQELCSMVNQTPEQLIGYCREDIPFPELRSLFLNDGRVKIYSQGTPLRHLKLRSRKLPDSSNMSLHCFQDIADYEALREENARLQQQVEELSITDELTGLANRRSLNRVLNAQVTRSRRYGNPLCLAGVEIELDQADQQLTDEMVLNVSRYLRERLRWVDLIARWSENLFMLVLPETNAEDCSKLLDKINREYLGVNPSQEMEQPPRLRIGLAEWQKGNDSRMLIQRVMDALVEVKQTDPTPPPG